MRHIRTMTKDRISRVPVSGSAPIEAQSPTDLLSTVSGVKTAIATFLLATDTLLGADDEATLLPVKND